MIRRPVLAVILALVALPALLAGPAGAADMYRYWSFWTSADGTWTFVETSPTQQVPPNGSVNGWRYGVGGVSGADTRAPRSQASFTEICGSEAAPAGQKRVAEIIDSGTPKDAPSGTTPPKAVALCATVPDNANAVQTLQSVTSVRVENGMVCGVDGYPPTGCGEVVAGVAALPSDSPTVFAMPDDAQQAPATSSSSGSVPVALIGVAGLVAVLAVVAVLITRRRRS